MNPLSLLTKGHTFGGVKDRRGAYKLSVGYALPHFNSPKVSALPLPATPLAATPLQTALFEQPQPRSAVGAAVPPKRDGAVPTVPKVMPGPFHPRPLPENGWRRAARWWNGFFTWRPAQAKPAPSVQTELALEKVTVVRNDLSEDDLVVVTVEKKPRILPGEKVHVEQPVTNP
jgi:hypothetical protein